MLNINYTSFTFINFHLRLSGCTRRCWGWISLFKCSFPQFSNKIHRQLFFARWCCTFSSTIVYNNVQPLISCKQHTLTRIAWHSLITFNLQIRHLSAVVCRFYPGDAFTYRLGSIRWRYVLCYYSTAISPIRPHRSSSFTHKDAAPSRISKSFHNTLRWSRIYVSTFTCLH